MLKLLLRSLIFTVIATTVLLPSFSRSQDNIMFKDQVAVIMYHHIHDKDKSSATVTSKLFKDQLVYLKDKGYRFITLKEFESFLAGGSVPNNAVLVTFDDGYKSFYEYAYPILRELQVPAVNFIITEVLDNPLGWAIPFMSQQEIKELTIPDSDFIDAQCHTDSLHSKTAEGSPYLTTQLKSNESIETENEYKARIVKDTKTCISKLLALHGKPVDFLTYPFGAYNELAAQLVREGGIRYAFTIVPEMTTRDADPMQIPRINAGSPYITPQSLHNTIIRRVVAVDHPFNEVPLSETIRQLGGQVIEQGEPALQIHFQQKIFMARVNDTLVMTNQETIQLKKPIVKKANDYYIHLDDLQRMLDKELVFNPNTNKYSVRRTPRAEK